MALEILVFVVAPVVVIFFAMCLMRAAAWGDFEIELMEEDLEKRPYNHECDGA